MSPKKPAVESIDSSENIHKYTAPALEGGLEILEVLATGSGFSLTEIAKRVDKSRTSVFRILAVLRRVGYAEYSTKYRLYRLSHKMFKISHQDVSVDRVTSVSAPIMRTLSDRIGESCYLAFFSQGGTLVMARQEAERLNNVLLVKVGSTDSLMAGAAGHIILTFASEEEREEMIAAAKLIRGDVIKINATLKKMIARVAEQGYEVLPSAQFEGVIEIGFPVFNQFGQLAGTLAVSSLKLKDPSAGLVTDELLESIGNAAADISSALGYEPEPLDY
ncbi:IclR family transcriptional regulator [Porticoccus sp. GXU_MW_L64]